MYYYDREQQDVIDLPDEGFFEMPVHLIAYSSKYYDSRYEYRHVILPDEIARQVPNYLMTETEWKELGIRQSNGWVHYMQHYPEPHVILFRRKIYK